MLARQREISPAEFSLNSASIPAIVTTFGPNLMAAVTALTHAELERFLDYKLSDAIAKNAEGEITEIYRRVQRQVGDRASAFAKYIERTILEPRSLDHPDQGYLPAITLIANRQLKMIGDPQQLAGGGIAQTMLLRDSKTTVIISDGVGRVAGIELEAKNLRKASAGPREYRLRHALETLRIPMLILFPQHGELGEEHMAQALFDQNTKGTVLSVATAMTRDMRSPYKAIIRRMGDAGLDAFGVGTTTKYPKAGDPDYVFVMGHLLRFVRVAVEGAKAAESAKGVDNPVDLDANEVESLAATLSKFWLRIINSANANTAGKPGSRFTPADAKHNMALTTAGMAALGVIASELFRVRAGMSEEARNEAIDRVAQIPWDRTDDTWKALLIQKFDSKTGESKGLQSNAAGASAVRAVRNILWEKAFGYPYAERKDREAAA
jgi:hypothetical protein